MIIDPYFFGPFYFIFLETEIISQVLVTFTFDGKDPHKINLSEEGIVACLNDKHPLKTFSPIDVTEEGIVIFVKEKAIFEKL